MTTQDSPKPVLLVRRARPKDLRAIMAIEKQSFPVPWSAEMIGADLASPGEALYLVAELNGEVVAYLGGWFYDVEFHLGSLATAPAFRRRGLAEILVLLALQTAAEAGSRLAVLEYRVSNLAAAALYAKLGFRVTRLRRRYYPDNQEDAVEAVFPDLRAPGTRKQLTGKIAAWQAQHDYDLHTAPQLG